MAVVFFQICQPKILEQSLSAAYPTANSLGCFKMYPKFDCFSPPLLPTLWSNPQSSLDDYYSPLTILPASTTILLVCSAHSRHSQALKLFVRSQYSSIHSAQNTHNGLQGTMRSTPGVPTVHLKSTTTFLPSSPTIFLLTQQH